MTEWSLADIFPTAPHEWEIRRVRDLSPTESESLLQANQTLRRLLGRTTFSVLSSNYQAFLAAEKRATEVATRGRLMHGLSIEAARDDLITSIVNFLTSMRMFLDHTEAELKRRDRDDGGERLAIWKAASSAEYDGYFAYRFLYKFRNYIQHVGLPLSMFELHTELGDDGTQTGTVFLGETPRRLVDEWDKWSTVANELRELTGDLDLSEQIDLAMECLTRLAEVLLRQDLPDLSRSVNTVDEILGSLKEYRGEPWLVQFSGQDETRVDELQPIDLDRLESARAIATMTGPD